MGGVRLEVSWHFVSGWLAMDRQRYLLSNLNLSAGSCQTQSFLEKN